MPSPDPSVPPVRLVCFDLGGVLVRICRSWDQGCRAAGIEFRAEPNHVAAFAEGWRDLNRAYQSGRIAAAEFYRRFSALTDGLYAPGEVERVHECWILGEYAGTIDVIEALHAAGVETTALSNSCLEHWLTMPAYPSVQALGRRIGSHEINEVKPDEAAYRAVERMTGHGPESILFFDDKSANTAAAKQYGWRAVTIDPGVETRGQIVAGLEAHGVLGGNVETDR